MNPAVWPLEDRPAKLLVVGSDDQSVSTYDALPSQLAAGDLLVLNDAATLPGSLSATLSGQSLEIRLAGQLADGAWLAVGFGSGSWRVPTEDRPPPPDFAVGSRILFAGRAARVRRVRPESPRLVELVFEPAPEPFWAWLYRVGSPIQYAHVAGALGLGQVQTGYATRPWAVELPSAGRPLSWELLLALKRQGVEIAALTHAAGLSATGDAALDAALPLPERFHIPQSTVAAVARTRARGGRVLGVGTTVVRALEGCVALHGELRAGDGVTDLKLSAERSLSVVDGVLTGVHEPGSSHHELLQAFAPQPELARALATASSERFLLHEFGDGLLIWAHPHRSRAA